MNNTTIVTAVYYSNATSVMGGRGWDFSYYKPSLYAIAQLNAKRVVVYHDKHQEPSLVQFVNDYNLSNFDLRLMELEKLPYYDTIYKIKENRLKNLHGSEETYSRNNRLHIVCTSKPWFLTETIRKYKIKNDPVMWIDAGLFHHALFPESIGGVELARFDEKNYYPIKETSKINATLGNQFDTLFRQDNKIYGYATQVIRLPLEWDANVAPVTTIANFIGGIFGGMPVAIQSMSNKFYELLEQILAADIVPLEEGIMSVVHANNVDLFYLNTFDTWYHDVPTDPCYFLNEHNTLYSFYRAFFALPEKKENRLQTHNIMDNTYVHPAAQSTPIVYEKYDLPNIAVYGSHNASVAIEYQGKILEVVEIERFLNVKNAGYAQYYVAHARPQLANMLVRYFKDKYGFTEYGYCLHQHCETIEGSARVLYWKQFPAKHYIECKHHESHAAGTFYQSPFQKALIVSFDGGGNDGFFKIYLAERGKPAKILHEYRTDLGFPYMIFGEYLGDIKKEAALNLGNLVYAGKVLGLQSYGTPVEEWIPYFKEMYLSSIDGTTYQKHLDVLGEKIGVEFSTEDRLRGDIAYQVAATSQAAFEEIFFEYVDEFAEQYSDLPICLSGGCALNIVLNTKVKERYNREVFVGPNPNDCGLAVGMLANMIRPEEPIDITYGGPEVLDKNRLPEYVERYYPSTRDAEGLARELQNGQIVGLVQGRSEHGPRALGNRSILCNPLIADMKDKLNARVKHREWYRPFAPVVRLEDVSEYFEWEGESRWMSFCPKVRDEYKDIMPAIVHIDGTARVQTITREQNEFLYDVLTQFKHMTGVGVLLNTSFNVDGKPILSTLADAFRVLETTELDALHIDGFFFDRKMGLS
jgi:carbamoyltransferase